MKMQQIYREFLTKFGNIAQPCQKSPTCQKGNETLEYASVTTWGYGFCELFESATWVFHRYFVENKKWLEREPKTLIVL